MMHASSSHASDASSSSASAASELAASDAAVAAMVRDAVAGLRSEVQRAADRLRDERRELDARANALDARERQLDEAARRLVRMLQDARSLVDANAEALERHALMAVSQPHRT